MSTPVSVKFKRHIGSSTTKKALFKSPTTGTVNYRDAEDNLATNTNKAVFGIGRLQEENAQLKNIARGLAKQKTKYKDTSESLQEELDQKLLEIAQRDAIIKEQQQEQLDLQAKLDAKTKAEIDFLKNENAQISKQLGLSSSSTSKSSQSDADIPQGKSCIKKAT